VIERPSSGPIPPDTQVPPRERVTSPTGAERRRRPFWRELPVLLVIALAVAILIKSFLLQAFYIPSESMEPTLDVGDRVLVEKVTYRFQDPQRGDVVVFERDLTAPASDEKSLWTEVGDSLKGLFGFPVSGNEDFIKRVVGIGGDTVEGRAGGVYVNGDRLEEPYLASGIETSTFGPVRVPPGMIFVMGDNRTNSEDSRVIGPVPDDTIVGKALVILWPPSHASDL
jgi:signal peptidase I